MVGKRGLTVFILALVLLTGFSFVSAGLFNKKITGNAINSGNSCPFENPRDLAGNYILVSKAYYGDNYTQYAERYCQIVQGCLGFDSSSVVVKDDSVKACRCDDFWGCPYNGSAGRDPSCVGDVSSTTSWERVGSVTCTGCPDTVCGIGEECKNLYWYDNSNFGCSQREFCGAYAYYGLKTFNTESECVSNLISEHSVCFSNEKCYLTSDDGGRANITINSKAYIIELLSASDTFAVINVNGETKEISEGSSKTLGGLVIKVNSVDEQSNLVLKAQISYSLTENQPTNQTCTDDDGGLNYYVKGHLIDNAHNANYYDFCSGNMTVKEYYCGGDNYMYEYHNCTGGCIEGACITRDLKVFDSYGEHVIHTGDSIKFADVDIQVAILEYDQCVSNPCTETIKKQEVRFYDVSGGFRRAFNIAGESQAINLIRANKAIMSSEFSSVDVLVKDISIFRDGYENDNNENSNAAIIELISHSLNGTCIDSDGGLNYYVEGKVSGFSENEANLTNWEDHCISSDILSESYCEGNTPKQISRDCGMESKVCVDGACVGGTNGSVQCYSDLDCGIDKECKDNVCIETEDSCDLGCSLDGKCYPFGYRKNGMYCSDEYRFVLQIQENLNCDNNFECDSNVCVSGECVSSGLMQRILDWFRNLFG